LSCRLAEEEKPTNKHKRQSFSRGWKIHKPMVMTWLCGIFEFSSVLVLVLLDFTKNDGLYLCLDLGLGRDLCFVFPSPSPKHNSNPYSESNRNLILSPTLTRL
jgi:hypothetical protein